MKIILPAALIIALAWFTATISKAQNLFVTAQGNIIEMTPNGTPSTFASGLGSPSQLAFNSAGNLFVMTTDGNVFEYTLAELQSTVASGLSSPQAMIFDNSGNLYVSQFNGDITEIATNGTQSTFAFGLSDPTGLAFDSQGDLFVANKHNNSITEIDTNGTKSTVAFGLSGPLSLVFDSSGNLFVGNTVGDIVEITTNGSQNIFASGLNNPVELAFDNAGNLFEADEGSGNIYEFAPDGTPTNFASGPNYQGLAIQFLPELQAITTNQNFQITVSMPSPYYPTILQASTNLINWCNVSTNTSPFTFTDSASSHLPANFFRACGGL